MSRRIVQTNLPSAVMLSACVLLAGCAGEKTREPGRYYDDGMNFSIEFPAGWEIREGDGMEAPLVEAVSPWESDTDIFSEHILIDVTELSDGNTLEGLFEEMRKEQALEFRQFEELEHGYVEIGEKDAKYLFFDIGMEEGSNRVLSFTLVEGKRGYLVSCVAQKQKFEEYRPVFEKSIYSFRCE